MRILHTADVHLRNDSDHRWHALGEVLDRAAALSADVVTISGDLFDRNIDAHQLKTPLRGLFDSHAIDVLVIPGNHDGSGLRHGDFYGERVTVMASDDHTVDREDVRFIALPFAEGGADRTLERLHAAATLRWDGAKNVLLFHGELLDLVPGGGAFGDEDPDYMPVRLASFDSLGFDYVLAGHFHKGFDVHRYEGGYFVYPGSPASITLKETGRRHADVVDVGQPPRREPLDTHHYEQITVRLDPFDERHPVDVIDEALSGLHARAKVVLTIGGFVSLSALGLTELELHEAIKVGISRWPIKDIDARWTDVRDVTSHDLFKKFNARLSREGASIPAQRRAQLTELVIQSLMELVDAR